jgi:hypothetical protein
LREQAAELGYRTDFWQQANSLTFERGLGYAYGLFLLTRENLDLLESQSGPYGIWFLCDGLTDQQQAVYCGWLQPLSVTALYATSAASPPEDSIYLLELVSTSFSNWHFSGTCPRDYNVVNPAKALLSGADRYYNYQSYVWNWYDVAGLGRLEPPPPSFPPENLLLYGLPRTKAMLLALRAIGYELVLDRATGSWWGVRPGTQQAGLADLLEQASGYFRSATVPRPNMATAVRAGKVRTVFPVLYPYEAFAHRDWFSEQPHQVNWRRKYYIDVDTGYGGDGILVVHDTTLALRSGGLDDQVLNFATLQTIANYHKDVYKERVDCPYNWQHYLFLGFWPFELGAAVRRIRWSDVGGATTEVELGCFPTPSGHGPQQPSSGWPAPLASRVAEICQAWNEHFYNPVGFSHRAVGVKLDASGQYMPVPSDKTLPGKIVRNRRGPDGGFVYDGDECWVHCYTNGPVYAAPLLPGVAGGILEKEGQSLPLVHLASLVDLTLARAVETEGRVAVTGAEFTPSNPLGLFYLPDDYVLVGRTSQDVWTVLAVQGTVLAGTVVATGGGWATVQLAAGVTKNAENVMGLELTVGQTVFITRDRDGWWKVVSAPPPPQP